MARSVADLAPTPKNDAYTVLLTISMTAMIGACLLLWYDIQSYPTLKPSDTSEIKAPAATVPAPTATPAEPAKTPPTPPAGTPQPLPKQPQTTPTPMPPPKAPPGTPSVPPKKN